MLNDLHFAFQMLATWPGFTWIGIAALALGIGANTAVFSVVNAVLLRPLPYHHAARLIDLFSLDPAGGRDGLSMAELQDLRGQMSSLEDLAGFQSESVNLTGGERPERVLGAFVSTNFLKVFQLTPVLRRTLACYFPARRAARVDPVIALRSE